MKKSYLILLLLINLLTAFAFPIQAESNYTKEDMEKTLIIFAAQNEWYQKTDRKAFSEEVWEKYGLLVLEKTAQKEKIEYKSIIENGIWNIANNKNKNNQWRYLGTTPEGYLVENPDYPADAYNGKPFSKFNWIENQNERTS